MSTEEQKGPCVCCIHSEAEAHGAHAGSCVFLGTVEERLAWYKWKSRSTYLHSKKMNNQSTIPLNRTQPLLIRNPVEYHTKEKINYNYE